MAKDLPEVLKPQNPNREIQTRKLFRHAGLIYGVIFGLGYALFTWGYDGLLLGVNGADLAWVKFALGFPVVIILGGLTGWLASLSTVTAVPVIMWMVTGGLFGLISGHIPFEGITQVVWFKDPRLQGEIISAFGESATVRTTLLILILTVYGALVGFIEKLAIQWAWDRGTSKMKISWGSLGMLLVGIPMALAPALVVDGLLHRPLRAPQQLMGTLVRQVMAGKTDESGILGTNYRSIKPFSQKLTGKHVSHFIEFSSAVGAWDSAYIDVIFDDGFMLRCASSSEYILYCDDFSKNFYGWIGDLVHSGLFSERPWLETRVRRLAVEENVVFWLKEHKDQLSENFEVYQDGQLLGWIFLLARFDNGFEMVCRFNEAAPIVVDSCTER